MIQKLITAKELSESLRITTRHLYNLVNQKKIPYFKANGKLLFSEEKIKEWLENSSK
jgi:excisionase family DNA binding protein